MSFFKISGQRTFPPCYWKLLFQFILSFLLSNIFFFGIAYYLHATRLLINIDYIIPCLLLLFSNLFIRIFGIIVLILLMLIEIHLLLLKFFPFLNFAMIYDLFPFVFIGPKYYLFMFCVLLLGVMFVAFSAWFLNKNQQKFYPIIFSVLIIFLYLYAGVVYRFEFNDNHSYDSNHWSTDSFYINSQSLFYKKHFYKFETEFVVHLGVDVKLVPYKNNNNVGIDSLNKPHNNKILFILAESFGVLNDDDAQQEIFKKLYEKSEYFDFIEDGFINIDDMATVEAEFRELCKKSLENGFKFKNVIDKDVSSCTPHLLNQQGYKTVAFHGATSVMYGRNYFYPKLGFQKIMFNDDMLDKKRCHSFPGTCDSEIFPLIANEFVNNDKVFVYWLTLTSHHPYLEQDIFNHRFDCNKHDIHSSLCNNIKMHTQFIDQLADLSLKPEMRGVEVMVVGDHAAHGIAFDDTLKQDVDKVSFIHFKIKE
ncbi:MAG: sulfatase-like hydrolase/transferase [Neisseriaceae bacterium]|nr:sulfatase-like hydrolase/transferase [Neisseriaceae bacterium]